MRSVRALVPRGLRVVPFSRHFALTTVCLCGCVRVPRVRGWWLRIALTRHTLFVCVVRGAQKRYAPSIIRSTTNCPGYTI